MNRCAFLQSPSIRKSLIIKGHIAPHRCCPLATKDTANPFLLLKYFDMSAIIGPKKAAAENPKKNCMIDNHNILFAKVDNRYDIISKDKANIIGFFIPILSNILPIITLPNPYPNIVVT